MKKVNSLLPTGNKIFFLIVIFSMVFSGCSRRMPVIVSQASQVVDYVPEEMLEEDIGYTDRAPLLDKYFDPFQAQVDEYIITRGDVLEVSIFGKGNEDTLVDQVVVAPDGKLYYMFLDGIYAEGRTVKDLSDELESLMTDLFINPEVTIIPKHVADQNYMILGKIGRPGVYPIVTSLTLQQVIGEAGGISLGGFAGTTIAIANLRESFLVRDGKKLDIDFERLLYTDGSDQNIFIRPGDYIYIASSLEQQIYLLGHAGSQKPVPYKDGLTLIGVLAGSAGITGGVNATADTHRVLIVRGSLEAPRVIQADIIEILEGRARDIYLVPGDIVYVQNKKVQFGRELVNSAIRAFISAYGGSAGSHFGRIHWFPGS